MGRDRSRDHHSHSRSRRSRDRHDSHHSRSRSRRHTHDSHRSHSEKRDRSRHDSHKSPRRESNHHSSHQSAAREGSRHQSSNRSASRKESVPKVQESAILQPVTLETVSAPAISLSLKNKKEEGKTAYFGNPNKSVSSFFGDTDSANKEEISTILNAASAEAEDVDPFDAFMKNVDQETRAGIKESLVKDRELQQKHFEEEEAKEEERLKEMENKPVENVITLEEILNSNNRMEEEKGDEDEYYEKFKETLKKQKEAEEKALHKERVDKLIQNSLGYTDMQDDYVEEYADDEEEPSALQQLEKKIQKKILEPVDHSQIQYIPINKAFYIESPRITQMSEDEIAKIRSDWRMVIRGKNYPRPILAWSQCGLSEKALMVINKLKYKSPFPIQCQSIPTIMSGREVIAVAKTGSGKTLAYLLPLFRHIIDQPPVKEGDGPIGLILAPARELVAQIYNEASKFCKVLGIRVTAVYGGTNMTEQINSLKRGSEIIVCTPGRMIEILCLNQGRLVGLRRLSYVVLDEADRMLDMGFEPQITMILRNARPDRQLVMFSATFPAHVEKLAMKILKKPVMIVVGGRTEVASEIQQTIEVRAKEEKYPRLLQILSEWYDRGLILIFVDKQQKADFLFRDLLRSGYYSFTLHGGMDQQDRDQTIADFKNKTRTILIATSVAGRGIHVNDLVLVVNYDCPNHLEDYVHRVGRTGRAGNKGTAITFITPQEEQYAGDMVKALKQSKAQVPTELQKLADSFEAKVKAGDAHHHSSGYNTKGFKFDEAEAGEKEVLKSMQRRQLEVESGIITAEEAQQQEVDEEAIRDKFNIKLVSTEDLEGIESVEKGAVMLQLLRKMEESSEEEEGGKEEDENELMNEDGTVNRKSVKRKGLEIVNSLAVEGGEGVEKLLQVATDSGTATSSVLMDAIKAVQSIEDSIQFKQGIQKIAVNGKPFYFEEVEINDYPQKARFALNNRTEMDRIQEWSGASVGIRGNYVPPGRRPALGSRRLHLYIEADAPAKVKRAKAECIQFLESATKGAEADGEMSYTR